MLVCVWWKPKIINRKISWVLRKTSNVTAGPDKLSLGVVLVTSVYCVVVYCIPCTVYCIVVY